MKQHGMILLVIQILHCLKDPKLWVMQDVYHQPYHMAPSPRIRKGSDMVKSFFRLPRGSIVVPFWDYLIGF